MLNFLVQVGHFLPVLVAANVALSAIGGVFSAFSNVKSPGSISSPATTIGTISGYVKKVIDLFSANLPH